MDADFFPLFDLQIKKIPKTVCYVVGFSGGLDSTVLLHLMWRWCSQHHIQLKALHIHHGINSQADAFEKNCEQFCQLFSIPFLSQCVQVHSTSQGLEASARAARYQACEAILNVGEILLFAHHADDQAETVLLQLMRGSGVRGLSAMPDYRIFGKGFLARPLLPFSREAILNYAIMHNLSWVEDQSNEDLQLSRNFLRKKIMPVLKMHWGDPVSALCQSANHCARAQQVVDQFMIRHYLQSESKAISHILSYEKIKKESLNIQLECLRTFIHGHGFRMPPQLKLETFVHQVQTAASDRFPILQWDEVEIRKYGERLFLMKAFPSQTIKKMDSLIWHLGERVEIFLGCCQSDSSLADHSSENYLSAKLKQIEIRFRQGNAAIKLHQHHQSLKNIFQMKKIPPWWRDHWPLLYYENECVGVLGIVLAKSVQANPGEVGFRIDFFPDETTHEFRSF